MRILPPLPQQSRRELERPELWLPERDGLQFCPRDGLKHGLETRAQGAHANAGETVVSGPDDVVMGEEDGGTLVEVLRAGAQPSVLAHAQVEDDLLVSGPVAGVGEDEDGFDVNLAVVTGPGRGEFLICQLAERGRVLIVLDDVAWGDDIAEAVAFGNFAAFLAFATNHEDGVIFFRQFAHRSVAADELAGGDFHFQLSRELEAALFFRFAAAVGYENIRSAMEEVS